MATEFSTVDLAAGSITLVTDEITLAKRGGLIASTDGRQHEITVTVTDGRNGWQSVVVSSSTDWGSPMEFGFILRDPQTGKPRWSYNRRPHQLTVDARKMVRVAQKAARDGARTTEQPAAVAAPTAPRPVAARPVAPPEDPHLTAAKRIISAYDGADSRWQNALNAADVQYRSDGSRPGWREHPDHAGYEAAVAVAREQYAADRQAAETLAISLGISYGQAIEIRNAHSRARAQAQIDHAEYISYGDGSR